MDAKHRPRKHTRLIEVLPIDVGALTGDALPVKMLKVPLGGDHRAVVFTVSRTVKAGWDDKKVAEVSRVLGDLVHPNPATLIVLPDGETLHAYEVEGE